MKKKGMWALEQLGKYMLVIASFIIVLAFMYSLLSSLQEESVEQACRASTTLRSNLQISVGGQDIVKNLYPINCKTQDVRVPEDTFPRGLTTEDKLDLVQYELAESMAKCWWMFGNGHFNNILDSGAHGHQMCHVCYSVFIPEIEDENGNTVSLPKADFFDYLLTHTYSPGLLQGGNVLVGDTGISRFTPQDSLESSRESRRLTVDRLVVSQTRLSSGVADFANVFSNPADAGSLRTALTDNNVLDVVEQAYIIIPSLPEDAYESNKDLAIRLLNEWSVGDGGKANGMVFLFDLNTGVFMYATGFGADALFSGQAILSLFDQEFVKTLDETQDPAKAIIAFAESITGFITDIGKESAQNTIAFQNTYSAYLTGGLTGAKIDPSVNDDLRRQGAISTPTSLDTIRTGERYAVFYFSQAWGWDTWLTFWNDAKQLRPNAIGFAPHADLFGTGRVCNVYAEDG